MYKSRVAWMSKQVCLTALDIKKKIVLSLFRGKIPLFQVYNLSSGRVVQPTGIGRHDEYLAWAQTVPYVFAKVIIMA